MRRLLRQGVRITYLVADPEAALTVEYARRIGDPDLPVRAAESAPSAGRGGPGVRGGGPPRAGAARSTRHLPTCYLSLVDADSASGRCRTSHYLDCRPVDAHA